MVARNINISIQNCKTDKQSQASLCHRPKLVSDLVQASNNITLHKDTKDASTSEFLSFLWSLSLFFVLVRLFCFLFFLAPLPFTFCPFVIPESAAQLKLLFYLCLRILQLKPDMHTQLTMAKLPLEIEKKNKLLLPSLSRCFFPKKLKGKSI